MLLEHVNASHGKNNIIAVMKFYSILINKSNKDFQLRKHIIKILPNKRFIIPYKSLSPSLFT